MSRFVIDCDNINTAKSARICRGNQIKFKTYLNNKSIWVKLDMFGYEGASEVIASRVAANSNIPNYFPVIMYYPCYANLNGRNFCGCWSYDFQTTGVSELSFEQLCSRTFGESFYVLLKRSKGCVDLFYKELLRDLNIDFLWDYFSLLFSFDALIYNEDRHTNNILLMRDRDGKFFPAPLFDNGAAFCSNMFSYDITRPLYTCLRKVKAKPFLRDFENQASLATYNSQVELNMVNNTILVSDLEEYYDRRIIGRISSVLREKGLRPI